MADLKDDVEFNALKPDRVTVPTLVLFGENDPGVTLADAGQVLRAARHAGQADGGAARAPITRAQLEDTHEAWIAAVVNFINRPPARR